MCVAQSKSELFAPFDTVYDEDRWSSVSAIRKENSSKDLRLFLGLGLVLRKDKSRAAPRYRNDQTSVDLSRTRTTHWRLRTFKRNDWRNDFRYASMVSKLVFHPLNMTSDLANKNKTATERNCATVFLFFLNVLVFRKLKLFHSINNFKF